jgi:hypothetical protein
MSGQEKKETRIRAIDSGAAVNKGVSELRESQKPSKPAGLVRPQGLTVPKPTANNGGQNTTQKQ